MFSRFANNEISEKQLCEECNCLPLSYAGGHSGIEVTKQILSQVKVCSSGLSIGKGSVLPTPHSGE